WNVPLLNLKDREHRKQSFEVPLAPRAVEIVREMEKASISVYVFPGQRKAQPLSNMAFLTLLKRMNATPKGEQPDPDAKPRWHDPASGRAITAHGFRATFKTWAEEVATFPHAAIEHAMGHKVGGKVEIRNVRSTLISFSNGSRARLFSAVDALGCLRSLRARSALDGVSWVQGGSVEIAVSPLVGCVQQNRRRRLLPRQGVAPHGSWIRPPVSWIAGA